MINMQMKKDLQRVVRQFRSGKGTHTASWTLIPQRYKYPTVIMKEDCTAIINFGVNSAARQSDAKRFMVSTAFDEWCWRHNILDCYREINGGYLQICINYAQQKEKNRPDTTISATAQALR